MSGKFTKRARFLAAGGALTLALACAPASGQIVIKNKDVDFKLGVLGQFWGDWTQSPKTGGYAQNLYLRRGRLLFGGDVGEDISFFFETDDPNLGKTPKALNSGFLIQDAFIEWKVNNAFRVDGGLMLVPFARQPLQSPASYYQIDISNISTVNNSSTSSSALRDMGFQAGGFFLQDHLLYRMGMFEGERDSNARNALRTAGYV
jgi:Phosphate-selective porin O and P